jgi:hypothetical protein
MLTAEAQTSRPAVGGTVWGVPECIIPAVLSQHFVTSWLRAAERMKCIMAGALRRECAAISKLSLEGSKETLLFT